MTTKSNRRRPVAGSLTVTGFAALLLAVPTAVDGSEHPLTVAAEVGFAPWVMKNPDGSTDGFSVELAREVADRLGRPGLEVIDVVWANIFAGLYANRYEYIIGPTTITESRARELLFTEPYIDVALGFLTGQNLTLESMEDLEGKRIGVTSGSVQDDWMAAGNAETYGITVQRFDATTDALQAILVGRSDGYMTLMSTGLWAVKQDPDKFRFDLHVETGQVMGLPFRPADVELRNEIELAVECIKADGTLAEIYERWFGRAPEPNSSTVTIYPGFGAPGWEGHAPEPHGHTCP